MPKTQADPRPPYVPMQMNPLAVTWISVCSRLFLSHQVSLQRPKQTPRPDLPSESFGSRASERKGLSHSPGTQEQGHG